MTKKERNDILNRYCMILPVNMVTDMEYWMVRNTNILLILPKTIDEEDQYLLMTMYSGDPDVEINDAIKFRYSEEHDLEQIINYIAMDQ